MSVFVVSKTRKKKAQMTLELNAVIATHFSASCGHVYTAVTDEIRSKQEDFLVLCFYANELGCVLELTTGI